ncbi:hypothetical protein ES702_03917 [subsurface metagenome]
MVVKNYTLNAGCGCNTWGDVRIDIQTYSNIFYRKKTSVNIIGSVEHLPFKDKVFNETRCHHVLEHLTNPFDCVKELNRVTNGKIIIHVPVFHLYSLIIETITLVKAFMVIPFVGLSYFMDHLYKVRSWKIRYSDHKWYIKGNKINRIYFIFPIEYEIIIKKGVLNES